MKIGKKLIISMLALTLGALLLVELGLFAVIGNLKKTTEQMYDNLQADAGKTIEDGLYAMDSDSLGLLADMQTTVTESRLQIVKKAVEQSAEFARKLYASPEAYRNSPYSPVPLAEATDELTSRYMICAGIEESDALYEELRLISNIEEIFAPIMRYNDQFFDNLYVGTASGLFYQYTTNKEYPENYVATGRHWYVSAITLPGSVAWKETEIDSYGRPCITASKAVMGPDGSVVAVVAADVNLDQMTSHVIGTGLGETGTSFILGKEKDLLAYSNFEEDIDKTTKTLHNAFAEHFADPDRVGELIVNCAQNESGAFLAELDGREIFMTARKIPCTGWLMCTAINAEEITRPISEVKSQSDSKFMEEQAKMDRIIRMLIIVTTVFIAVLALSAAVIAHFVSRTISKPIIRLTNTVKNIGEGDFETKSDIDSRDEVGELARVFNKMQDDLKLYTENLKTVTAEKERIGAELNVATQIQADMLPRIFPP